ncbi:MAG: DNA polymerase III subunit delta [Alphaproteobacteria bacterium]
MKLPSERDVTAFLAGPKAGGALVYGLDGGQVRLRTGAIAEAWLGPNADAMGRLELSADEVADDPARLADELASMSLMGGKRVILVRDAGDKLLAPAEQALSLRAPGNFLLLYATDSLAGSKLRAWAERAGEIGCVPCYKDEGAGLEKLLRDTLTGYGLRARPDVIAFLAMQLGGDRQVILNELEKLSLYLGEEAEEVALEDAMDIVGENNDKSLDDLCFAIAGGDEATICALSDRLQLEGNAGVVLVRAAMRHFARLESLLLAREAGMSIDAAMESQRIFFKIKPKVKANAQRWSLPQLADAMGRLQLLELDSKRYSEQSLARLAHGFLQISRLPLDAKRVA